MANWHDALTKNLLKNEQKQTKRKYGNALAERNGRSFHSKGEAACYDYLLWLEKAGKIKILKLQDQLRLVDEEKNETVIYIADFKILNLETGQVEYAEFKGFEVAKWAKIKKFWREVGPGKLSIYKGNYRKNGEIVMVLTETIWPKKFDPK